MDLDSLGGKHAVVTAAGFLASHLCDRLVAHGARVTAVDNFKQPGHRHTRRSAGPLGAERLMGREAHRSGLRADVTGHVCAAAVREGVSVYLFGSTAETCQKMADELRRRYPGLAFAGIQPDRFREATAAEDAADVEAINASGAGIVLVGRGCPRQERWVADHLGRVHAAMLAVGAAFDYYAGTLRRPPAWMQRLGLEWLHRLVLEPRRLWRRYLVYNTKFVFRFAHAVAR